MRYNDEIAYSKLVDWCNQAERCQFDITKKLKLWGAEAAFIERCIARLRKNNLFNDARYAAAFAHDKSTLQRWGIHKIKLHLKARSIEEAFIQEAIEGLEGETHRENIRELATRKWPSIIGKNDYERSSKLIRYLMRKGFSYDSIRSELNDSGFHTEGISHP